MVMVVALLLLAGVDCEEEGGSCGPGEAERGRSYEVRVEGVSLLVELAAKEEERRIGLSGRREVPAGTGMLFVFPKPSPTSFWMKDTYVALTVAYLDEEGRITQMEDMVPESLEGHPSTTSVSYALEVPQGWFEQAGARVGTRVEFAKKLRRRLLELPAHRAEGRIRGQSFELVPTRAKEEVQQEESSDEATDDGRVDGSPTGGRGLRR